MSRVAVKICQFSVFKIYGVQSLVTLVLKTSRRELGRSKT